MATRKEQLFNAKKTASKDTNLISSSVHFRHNKKKGILEALPPHEKMLCALRKALTAMSDRHPSCRYFIIGSKVQLTAPPTTTAGKAGGPQSYRAAGRCKLGVSHADGRATTMVVDFNISFRDVVDDRGLADVEYFDPTSIDEISRSSPIDVSALA